MALNGAASLNLASAISSLWDGLNPHLVASIYEVDAKGNRVGDTLVKAAFTDDTTLELTLNWQSPFESAGPESSRPALMAMLQSGALQVLADSVSKEAGDVARGPLEAARGRTGITKLNSTQVFSGMPPIKFSAQILLRAWRDPEMEVERPLDQLMKWALPRKLAPEGTMASAAIGVLKIGNEVRTGARSMEDGAQAALETALPSLSPTMLAITYKGRTYSPLVIETISVPLGSSIDKFGRFVQLVVPISFSTLTAIDGADWMAYRRSM